jgi:excisionase family DNA binding protein
MVVVIRRHLGPPLKEKNMTRLSLSIEETLIATGIGRTKLYQLINSGELKARKIGARTFILKEDLEVFLKNLKSYPHENAGA